MRKCRFKFSMSLKPAAFSALVGSYPNPSSVNGLHLNPGQIISKPLRNTDDHSSLLSARGKQIKRNIQTQNEMRTFMTGAFHQTPSNILFSVICLCYFQWVFFPGLAGNCGSPKPDRGYSAAQCLSPGCLLGFQGSGSNLSAPGVTLTFCVTVPWAADRRWKGEAADPWNWKVMGREGLGVSNEWFRTELPQKGSARLCGWFVFSSCCVSWFS